MRTDYGQTVGGLTIPQLLGAAHDLRNAALVVKHAGHFQGALCDESSGEVCIVGAIDLATYRKLRTEAGTTAMLNTGWRGNRFLTWPAGHDGEVYRAEAAILVMSEVVPTGLCNECDDENPCHCGKVTCGAQPREPWEIVTHYNDNHCISGIMAIEILRTGAEHAELRAEIKRQANTDLRVAV